MQVGSFVIVTNYSSELYRRRCQVKEVKGDKLLIYSEGLEQEEWIARADVQISKF